VTRNSSFIIIHWD